MCFRFFFFPENLVFEDALFLCAVGHDDTSRSVGAVLWQYWWCVAGGVSGRGAAVFAVWVGKFCYCEVSRLHWNTLRQVALPRVPRDWSRDQTIDHTWSKAVAHPISPKPWALRVLNPAGPTGVETRLVLHPPHYNHIETLCLRVQWYKALCHSWTVVFTKAVVGSKSGCSITRLNFVSVRRRFPSPGKVLCRVQFC